MFLLLWRLHCLVLALLYSFRQAKLLLTFISTSSSSSAGIASEAWRFFFSDLSLAMSPESSSAENAYAVVHVTRDRPTMIMCGQDSSISLD